jgi:hypothetical protein
METVINVVPESQKALVTESPVALLTTGWNGPLFVIGMWRSGTSLLYALLNKHPQIALMYEGDLPLLRPLFWVPSAEKRWRQRWELWNQALQRHGLDANQFSGDASSLARASGEVYREYARQKGALIGGDKSPNYFDSLTRLAEDFPEARFIVIWRDPASICRSVIRAAEGAHSWFQRRGMTLRVLLGMEAMRVECDHLLGRGVRIHELQYQSLVRNPVETMERICGFLGIPFVPEMASLDGADRSAIYEGGHHALVKGEGIVSSTQREEVLSPKLKSKIGRYLALWQEEDRGRWLHGSVQLNGDVVKPSPLERVSDRVRYRCLRLLDRAVIVIYCFAPLWLLKRFRDFKYRREEARAKAQQANDNPSPNSD